MRNVCLTSTYQADTTWESVFEQNDLRKKIHKDIFRRYGVIEKETVDALSNFQKSVMKTGTVNTEPWQL